MKEVMVDERRGKLFKSFWLMIQKHSVKYPFVARFASYSSNIPSYLNVYHGNFTKWSSTEINYIRPLNIRYGFLACGKT